MKNKINILLFFLINLGVPKLLAAQTANIVTFGSPSSTMSGELLLLVENIINEPHSQLQIVGQKKGLAYRNNSLFLLTGAKTTEKNLNDSLKNNYRTEKTFNYFETSRSLLVMSPETPGIFIEKIKNKKLKSIQYEGVNRFWDDLKWSKTKGGTLTSGEINTPFYDFERAEWNIGKQWKFSFFVTYKISYDGQEFEVTVLPKVYGGLARILSTLRKSKAARNALILSTGDVTPTPDAENTDRDALEKLSEIGPQIISVGLSEVIGLKKIIEPYQNTYKTREPPIQFISANVCRVENEKCEPVFKPYVIVEKSGIRMVVIGIASTADNNAIEKSSNKNPWLKNIKIFDPAPLLKNKILPEVHNLGDIIILVTNSTSEEYGKMYSSLNGVDLVFNKQQRKFNWAVKSEVEFSKFKERVPQLPVVEIESGDIFISDTQLSLKSKDLKITHAKILLDQTVNSDGDSINTVNEQYSNIFSGNDIVLPDHKSIYPEKIIITKEEFANLASELIRRELRAEVAVFNIQEQKSNIVGEQDASLVKTWVQDDEQIELVYLSGSDIKSLIELNKNFLDPNKLVIAGVDHKSRISGISIRDNEMYRVAISSLVSSNPSVFRPLANAKRRIDTFRLTDSTFQEDPNGKTVLMSDFLIHILRSFWKSNRTITEAERVEAYQQLYEFRSKVEIEGYWVNEIKNLQLEYSQMTTTDVSSFGNVQDSRLQTVDQRQFSSRLSYLATYRKYPFVNEVGLKAEYGKLELLPVNAPAITNFLSDDILFFANIGFPIYSVNNYPQLATEMGPYIEIAYNTEFEKDTSTLDIKKNLLSFYGWKFLNGQFLKSAAISLMHEKRFAAGSQRNLVGLNSKLELQKNLLDGHATYRSSIEFSYFLDDNDDTNADLRSRLVWDQYYDLKMYEKITFGPFLKYFTLTRKTLNETTQQTMVGVSFNFSNMWKTK